MKIDFKKIWGVIIILLALTLIYNSKRSDYENDISFYKKYVSGEILKIKRTRGVKVFFTENDFFYLDTYKGVDLKAGNTFQKNGADLIVFEKDKKGKMIEKGKGIIIKPKDSYFKHFFGIN